MLYHTCACMPTDILARSHTSTQNYTFKNLSYHIIRICANWRFNWKPLASPMLGPGAWGLKAHPAWHRGLSNWHSPLSLRCWWLLGLSQITCTPVLHKVQQHAIRHSAVFVSKGPFIPAVFVIKSLEKIANNLEGCISVFKCLLCSPSILQKSKLEIMGAVYARDSS